jgi:trimeric autotransporter adhesin
MRNVLLSRVSAFIAAILTVACLASATSASAASSETPTDPTSLVNSSVSLISDPAGNTAGGTDALYHNTGPYNTAFGQGALFSNTQGSANTASGLNALISNTSGDNNTANGFGALANTNGNSNTAVGLYAGYTNTTGDGNTFIGLYADANAGIYNNATAIGYGATVTGNNTIRLGNTTIVSLQAQVGLTVGSDRRLKKDIRALDSDLGLDFIEKLKPVSYRFRNGDETERYGFIAQDLEQALPASLHDTIEQSKPEHRLALINRENDNDRTYQVSYTDLLAPIVRALQQQQQEIVAERQQNAELRHALEVMERQVMAFKADNDALRHSVEALRGQVSAAR